MKRILHHVHSVDVNLKQPTPTDLAPWPKRTAQSNFTAECTNELSHFELSANLKLKNDENNCFSPKQEPCRNSHGDIKLEHSLNDESKLNVKEIHVDSNKKLNESTRKGTKQTKIEYAIVEKAKNDKNKVAKHDLLVADFKWRYIKQENLNLRYAKVFSRIISNFVLERLEKEIEYFSGDLLKVRVFGKWHSIPRKQVAFGEEGSSYAFSGNSLPAKPWNTCSIVSQLKDSVESMTGESFNFVLINRYANGLDHMGEHRDDEKELVPEAPIASLSFGEERQFIFKHKDSRGKHSKRNIPPLKMNLESGSLLLMDYPTNKFWYHSLPVRKNATNVRINLTFRKMISQR